MYSVRFIGCVGAIICAQSNSPVTTRSLWYVDISRAAPMVMIARSVIAVVHPPALLLPLGYLFCLCKLYICSRLLVFCTPPEHCLTTKHAYGQVKFPVVLFSYFSCLIPEIRGECLSQPEYFQLSRQAIQN